MTRRDRLPLLLVALALLIILSILLFAFLAQQAYAAGCDYVVQPGDTEYRIALTHGETVGQLQADNGLSGSLIYVGQCLTLPGTAIAGAEPLSNPTISGANSFAVHAPSTVAYAGQAYTVIPLTGPVYAPAAHNGAVIYQLMGLPGAPNLVFGNHADVAGLWMYALKLGDAVTWTDAAGRAETFTVYYSQVWAEPRPNDFEMPFVADWWSNGNVLTLVTCYPADGSATTGHLVVRAAR